ncbi:hypothetical protein CFP56_043075 [Quercus suber]|uniref:Uncharacterized protein n=1 Tax=Quercus suber TaxID=58331 RepID=A0AAW0LHL7_QUESU
MPERNVILTKDHAVEDSQALSPVLQMGSKIMEQLCREAYLLKKDQVIKLREVLEADKDGNFWLCRM